jgi:hypothetical protein
MNDRPPCLWNQGAKALVVRKILPMLYLQSSSDRAMAETDDLPCGQNRRRIAADPRRAQVEPRRPRPSLAFA